MKHNKNDVGDREEIRHVLDLERLQRGEARHERAVPQDGPSVHLVAALRVRQLLQ